MNRILLILVCVVLYACKTRNHTSKTLPPKNVLFIVVDDLTKSLNTYGNEKVISPKYRCIGL